MADNDPRIRRNHRDEQEAADRESAWLRWAARSTWPWFLAGVVIAGLLLTIGGAR